ncbi:hypothetical protein, partial [Nocardia farcinica]|uniref:hypothetical protein n=1 Tax=Nocardia farcinica TaxID=37329 RepID=UPI002456B2E7
ATPSQALFIWLMLARPCWCNCSRAVDADTSASEGPPRAGGGRPPPPPPPPPRRHRASWSR